MGRDLHLSFENVCPFELSDFPMTLKNGFGKCSLFTNINRKGLQRTANEYAEERRIYKDLISKNEK